MKVSHVKELFGKKVVAFNKLRERHQVGVVEDYCFTERERECLLYIKCSPSYEFSAKLNDVMLTENIEFDNKKEDTCGENKSVQSERKYYMVHNPKNMQPKNMHDSKESAVMEAKRLAGLAPGERFFVLEAVECYAVITPEPENIMVEHVA